MEGDLAFAAAGFVNVVCEFGQRDEMEVGGRVAGRQVPFGLRHDGCGHARDSEGQCGGKGAATEGHRELLVQVASVWNPQK